jgi:hypothetical protein
LCYIGLLAAFALTERPREDEALLSNPAFNLAFRGNMGTSCVEESGSSWKGIGSHTYNTLPVGILDLAVWFRIFGSSLLVARLASLFWELVMLASLFYVFQAITQRTAIAAIAVLITGFDYNVMAAAVRARPDALTAALGWAGIALYLFLRNRNLVAAAFAGSCCIAASGLAHPNGVVFLAAYLLIAIWLDRRRLGWRQIAGGFLPFVVGGALWGLYLLQAPQDAHAQLTANATAMNPLSKLHGGRFTVFLHPVEAVKDEIVLRYFPGYGLPVGDYRLSAKTPKALVLLAYAAGLIFFLADPALRKGRSYRLILALTAMFLFYFCFFDGARFTYYLIEIVPLLSLVLAAALVSYWDRKKLPLYAVCGFVAALAVLQAGGIVSRIRLDTYRNEYLPAATFLRSVASPQDLVFASSDFGFAYGFERNAKDEITLGYRSRLKPRFIVMESTYVGNFEDWAKTEPQYFQFMSARLKEYKVIYDKSGYKIYEAV